MLKSTGASLTPVVWIHGVMGKRAVDLGGGGGHHERAYESQLFHLSRYSRSRETFSSTKKKFYEQTQKRSVCEIPDKDIKQRFAEQTSTKQQICSTSNATYVLIALGTLKKKRKKVTTQHLNRAP